MSIKIQDGRYGKIMYYPNDIYIGKSIELYGEYSEIEVELWKEIITPNMTVIDVGANIGTHTLALSCLAKQVFAVEPQRQLAQMINGSLALNEISNTKVIFGALSDVAGTLSLPHIDYTKSDNFGGKSLDKFALGDITTVPLDSLNIIPQFIKIDVEGMEHKVLWGASRTINEFKPILYIENDRADNSKQLIEILMAHEYRMWWHITPLYNPDNFLKNPENVFPMICSVNMLCIHKDIPANITAREILSPDDKWNDV